MTERLSEEAISEDARQMTQLLRKPGEHRVDVPVACVITRFSVRRSRHVREAHRDYHRVLDEIHTEGVPGLLQSAFLEEGRTAYYTLSVWRDLDAIPIFGTRVPSHVKAARRGFGRVAHNGGAEVWSTKWQLVALSNNLNWGEFNLRDEVVRHQLQERHGLKGW